MRFDIELYWREKVIVKKILLLLFMLCVTLFNCVSAETLYRVKPAHFDISGAVVFIPVKANAQASLTNNLTLTKLENNNGVEINVASAVMDTQPQDVLFSAGNIKEFTISQDDKNVKIVVYFKDNYNVSNFKLGNINNNIIITTSSIQPYNMNYYINTYRENDSAKDYLEDLSISSKVLDKQASSIPNSNDKSMKEINQAFSNSNAGADAMGGNDLFTNYVMNDISGENTLRSKYYISDAQVLNSVYKINGAGTVVVKQPFLLDNPLRMVFDLPNTTINKKLHNKELKLSNGDLMKIAQFNDSTARLVVTSKQARQYIPVYSADSQSLLVANPRFLLTSHLPAYKSNIVKFNYQKASKQNNLLIEFDKPIVYAIKRNQNEMYIYFLNAEKYSDSNFHSAIKNTPYSDVSVHLLSTGMRVKIPLQNKDNINTYISPDGKLFKLTTEAKKVVEEKPAKKTTPKETVTKPAAVIAPAQKYTNSNNRKIVVLDAGHGGRDCGAIRENCYEKTINLDVTMKLKSILEKHGYRVYMTRTNDTYVSLEDRTIFTEKIYPGAFVSVHVNSCNAVSPTGIEVHYYHDNSIQLANCVHKKLVPKLNTKDRGLYKSRFYVINHTSVPAILVEIGFISNPAERAAMMSAKRQQATAEGIAEGIIDFLRNY